MCLLEAPAGLSCVSSSSRRHLLSSALSPSRARRVLLTAGPATSSPPPFIARALVIVWVHQHSIPNLGSGVGTSAVFIPPARSMEQPRSVRGLGCGICGAVILLTTHTNTPHSLTHHTHSHMHTHPIHTQYTHSTHSLMHTHHIHTPHSLSTPHAALTQAHTMVASHSYKPHSVTHHIHSHTLSKNEKPNTWMGFF